MKRLFDVVVASCALIGLAPVLLAAMAAIKFSSPGPIFYRQERIGLNGRPFSILKLRTMVVNADRIGALQTERHDPRITPIGRFLRRTSLDELPQVLNVIAGDMSIVGPRPYVRASEQDFTPEDWRRRHSVRPGVTGLAQALVRSEGTFEERLALDLDYVENHSVMRDLRIIWLTARGLIGSKAF